MYFSNEELKTMVESYYCSRYINYKYEHIDYDKDQIEIKRKIVIKKIFFYKQTVTNTQIIPIQSKFEINFTDIREIVSFKVGINKEDKIIYWKFLGTKRYERGK